MAKWNNTYIKGANGREIKFDNGGYIINISIPEDSLDQLKRVRTKSDKTVLTFKVSPLRNGTDQYGNTHSVFVSENTEEKKKEDSSFLEGFDGDDPEAKIDDLPF